MQKEKCTRQFKTVSTNSLDTSSIKYLLVMFVTFSLADSLGSRSTTQRFTESLTLALLALIETVKSSYFRKLISGGLTVLERGSNVQQIKYLVWEQNNELNIT